MTAATALIVADVIVGIALLFCGVLAMRRRPRLWEGAVMLLAGVTWFAGFLPGAALLHRGALVHLHLGHPTGRIRRPLAVVTVVASYLAAVIESRTISPWLTIGVAVLVAASAFDVHGHTSGPVRKAAVPALRAALAFAAMLVLSSANRLLGWRADLVIALAYDVVVAALVIFLLVDLLRGAWTDDTLADLVHNVGERAEPGGLESELRRALGDRTAQLAYRNVAGDYVDGRGRPVPVRAVGGRFVVPLDDQPEPAAVIIHGTAPSDDQTLVAGARTVARLAVANERLDAEIRARLDDVEASRRRIVEAADVERQRFAEELAQAEHRLLDEVEAHLRSLPLTEATPALEELAGLRSDLRQLSAGLRPTALAEGGLAAALPAVARRSPVPVSLSVGAARYPPAVEGALYFLVTEGLTNVARHADASHVELTVRTVGGNAVVTLSDDGKGGADPSRGTGLRGLADRIAALGGQLTVTDEAGGGTVLVAGIPLGAKS